MNDIYVISIICSKYYSKSYLALEASRSAIFLPRISRNCRFSTHWAAPGSCKWWGYSMYDSFQDGFRKTGHPMTDYTIFFFSWACSHYSSYIVWFNVWLLCGVTCMNLLFGNMAICTIYFAGSRTTFFCIHGWWTKNPAPGWFKSLYYAYYVWYLP